MELRSLRQVFVNNRAEQLPDDVYGQFVVPIHFRKLDLDDDKKSVLIEGGRGCGKTMFIRYFCHQTVFSQKRDKVSDNELSRVGLYWKPDVKFCRFLAKKGWIPSEYSELAFQHLVTLSILEDFSKSVLSIDNCSFEGGKINLSDCDVSDDVKLYLGDDVKVIGDVGNFVRKERAKFDMGKKSKVGASYISSV